MFCYLLHSKNLMRINVESFCVDFKNNIDVTSFRRSLLWLKHNSSGKSTLIPTCVKKVEVSKKYIKSRKTISAMVEVLNSALGLFRDLKLILGVLVDWCIG